MPEIKVDIVRANIKRGSQHEALVDIRVDGVLLIGGALLSFPEEKTDDQITDAAITQIYIPTIEQLEQEVIE